MVTAYKKLLMGRRIVDFELRPWKDKTRPGLQYNPIIWLDNGARITFQATEGEDEYGVEPHYHPAKF